MSFLSSFSHWLVLTLEPYGAPGLMAIAILDSSFLSFPEVNDFALMALSIRNHDNMWGLAAMTVVGSVIGCTLLYGVGRKGGEALLTKRFAAERVAKVRAWYDKYGMLAVIVPSLLPPPLPFKIFVLSAGAFRISWTRFILSVAIGRSIRYFTEGMLAVKYGEQATQMVKDNSARVGLILAGLIVIGALVVVYGRRRRRMSSGAVLLPLIAAMLFTGCVRTITTPENQRMKPSTPFTKAQALDRLRRLSVTVSSLETPIVLEGSTPEVNDKNKRKSISSLPGSLIVQRPGRINLYAGLVGQGFEIRSNGSQYEVFISPSKQVHAGTEDGPTAKSSCKLGDRADKFVSLKPREILDALVPDFRPLLDNPSIGSLGYSLPVVKDQRRYFYVDFFDKLSPESRILQKVWFDLSTPDVDIVRRQIFDKDGELERDTAYANDAPLGNGAVRYPTRFAIQFVATDTLLTITTDPKSMTLNTNVDPDAFELGIHNRNAEVCRLEPAAVVTQR